jgi:stage II sporulation protein D
MKRTLAVSLALYIAAFLIPLLAGGQIPPPPETDEVSSPSPSPSPPAASATPPPTPAPEPIGEMIPLMIDGALREMPLSEFIYGSVASEMPALYPEEALKAQAVAIRTLAMYAKNRPYHGEAWLCSNWECCLAYAPLGDKKDDWGERFDEFALKIKTAVDDTDGVVILYDGEPIEAVFFAASDGRTRSSAEVWGGEVPYLQSVGSTFDLEFPNEPRGHGVGMSQFGARQLALQGFAFDEILMWYYTGVEVR